MFQITPSKSNTFVKIESTFKMPTLCMVEYNYREAYRFRLPIIELRLSGTPHFFLLDTGAMETVISMKLKGILNDTQLLNKIPRNMGGIGGSAHGFATRCRFNFVGVSIPIVTFSESRVFDEVFPMPLSGIIGQDILQQFSSVEFCWKKGLVKFNV